MIFFAFKVDDQKLPQEGIQYVTQSTPRKHCQSKRQNRRPWSARTKVSQVKVSQVLSDTLVRADGAPPSDAPPDGPAPAGNGAPPAEIVFTKSSSPRGSPHINSSTATSRRGGERGEQSSSSSAVRRHVGLQSQMNAANGRQITVESDLDDDPEVRNKSCV